jgi:dihydrofolate reductase
MRKLVESTFISLDGDTSQRLMDWAPRYWDDEHASYEQRLLFDADALVLGRVTYDGFKESWPPRAGDAYADRMNALPKFVASHTLTETTWNASVLLGDGADAVADLKQGPGGTLLKFGTGTFSRALMERRLIDELHLWFFPVVAGVSDSLWGGIDVTHLERLDTTLFQSGIVVQVYGPKAA